jgi:8-hydroxy-5-deazaflavin:NADPH oxidoreductase
MRIAVLGTGVVGRTLAGSVIDLGDISAARGTEMLMPLWLRLMGGFGHAEFNIHIAHA